VAEAPLCAGLEGIECDCSCAAAATSKAVEACPGAHTEIRFVLVRSRQDVHDVLLAVHERDRKIFRDDVAIDHESAAVNPRELRNRLRAKLGNCLHTERSHCLRAAL